MKCERFFGRCADTLNLQLWLQRHGGSITQLHLRGARRQLTELPCCPKLADLELRGRKLLSSPNLAALLAALPSLQRINLAYDGYPAVVLPPGLLQQLPALTQLELSGGLSDAALQGLGSLTKCSHLVLNHHSRAVVDKLTAAGLVGLQELRELTFLQLYTARYSVWDIKPDINLPSLTQLTALQELSCDSRIHSTR